MYSLNTETSRDMPHNVIRQTHNNLVDLKNLISATVEYHNHQFSNDGIQNLQRHKWQNTKNKKINQEKNMWLVDDYALNAIQMTPTIRLICN